MNYSADNVGVSDAFQAMSLSSKSFRGGAAYSITSLDPRHAQQDAVPTIVPDPSTVTPPSVP
jgi:hypothetical protein